MAIKQDLWDEAKAMFEGGAEFKDIAYKTKIERTTISKKAKRDGWNKSQNSQLIDKEINVLLEKSQLNSHEITYHEAEVSRKVEFYKELDSFTVKTMRKAGDLMDEVDNGVNFKAIIDGVDKHSVTLGVSQRHANGVQISNTNAQQTNNAHLTGEALSRELRDRNLPIPDLD